MGPDPRLGGGGAVSEVVGVGLGGGAGQDPAAALSRAGARGWGMRRGAGREARMRRQCYRSHARFANLFFPLPPATSLESRRRRTATLLLPVALQGASSLLVQL